MASFDPKEPDHDADRGEERFDNLSVVIVSTAVAVALLAVLFFAFVTGAAAPGS